MGLLAAGGNRLTFAQPYWLAALALAALPVVLAHLARRRQRRVPPLMVAGQCLALALLAGALARPRAGLTARAKAPCLLLIDASGSLRGQDEPDRLPLPAGTPAERYYFGEGLSRDKPAAEAATNVQPVLRLIASRSPAGLAAAVIATDGRFTDTGWEGAAAAVAHAGARVLIVPADAPPADARIAALAARRRSDTEVDVTVSVVANAALRRTLTLRRGGREEPLLKRDLSLLADSPATLRVTDRVAPDAASEYTARLGGGDLIRENDSAAVLILPDRAAIGAFGPDRPLRRLLAPLGAKVRFLGGCDKLPASAVALAGLSAIVVVDPTGSALRPDQRRALAECVRTGGGLVLIGTGPHATPKDAKDPLNQVLPLVANPFQRRPLHLLVLLDRSGSMAGTAATRPGRAAQRKFDLAAEAVTALKEHLTPRDALTVITFADRPEVTYDSGGKPPDFAVLQRALQQVSPAGSTSVTPAIAKAMEAPAARGRMPMLLLLSDLATEDFDPSAWASKLRQWGAHLAVVAIGQRPPDRPAPPLETLTTLVKGAEYVRQDQLSGLARVFAGLVRRGRGPAIRRGRAAVVVKGPLFDTALTALPDVDAHILSGKADLAELLAATVDGDPLLARRSAGAGRSASVALPIGPAENLEWQNAPEVGRLVSAAVRWAQRGTNDPTLATELHRHGSRLNIAVSARRENKPVNDLRLSVQVWTGEVASKAPLEQTAPGRYEGSLPAPPDAPAAVAIRDDAGATLWQGSAPVMYPTEYRLLGADREGLQRLASLTGGRIVPARRLPGALRDAYARRLTDLWPWLLGVCLAVMLVEWCFARITRR